MPATYIIQAENYLKTRTLTEAQATAVIAQIKNAADVYEATGVNAITMLSAADKNEILSYITAAAKAIDLTITIAKQSNGQYLIVLKDMSGNIVASFSSSQVKQTGMDNSIIYVGMLIVVLAAGSVFVLRRNNLKATA